MKGTVIFEELDVETLDRVRLRIWRRFAAQLRQIPEAPDPDDLLQEALEDLWSGRRTYPDKDVKPETVLFKIVASKVANHCKKWRRLQARLRKEPPNPEGDQKAAVIGGKLVYIDSGFGEDGLANALTPVQTSSLRQEILVLVADDALLVHMVELQLNALGNPGKPLKAGALAQKLGVPVRKIYNANRRLKAKLEKHRSARRARSNQMKE